MRSHTSSSRSSSRVLGAPASIFSQDLHHPARAFAARRALAARLVHVELRDAKTELHHAAAIVDHDHRAGAEERLQRRPSSRSRAARRSRRPSDTGTDEPPGMTAFSSRPSECRRRGRRSARAATCRAGARSCPPLTTLPDSEKTRVPVEFATPSFAYSAPPMLDDLRDGRDRLDVVDQRRRGVEALRPPGTAASSAAGRACPRATRAARSPRRRCTRPRRGGDDRSTPPSSAGARATSSSAARSTSNSVEVLAADVDEDVLRLDRVRGDQAALDEPVRDARA